MRSFAVSTTGEEGAREEGQTSNSAGRAPVSASAGEGRGGGRAERPAKGPRAGKGCSLKVALNYYTTLLLYYNTLNY